MATTRRNFFIGRIDIWRAFPGPQAMIVHSIERITSRGDEEILRILQTRSKVLVKRNLISRRRAKREFVKNAFQSKHERLLLSISMEYTP